MFSFEMLEKRLKFSFDILFQWVYNISCVREGKFYKLNIMKVEDILI